MKKKQISIPDKEASIKKYITDFINAAVNNKKYSIDITEEERIIKEDIFQIFVDKKPDSPKLIISVFKASLLA